MTVYENSAARQAAAIRARARRGLWRRLTAALGVNPAARRADAEAAAWVVGGQGEAATAALLGPLPGHGWHVRHDLRPPGGRRNYDHVLTSPCGTAVVLLDSKQWRRNWPTRMDPATGRVHCGPQDRHEQIEKAARHAAEVREYLALPGVVVWPLLVVHGSPVAGGELQARVAGCPVPVFVLSPDRLVPRLLAAPHGAQDRRRADVVAARVDRVLRPYQEHE